MISALIPLHPQVTLHEDNPGMVVAVGLVIVFPSRATWLTDHAEGERQPDGSWFHGSKTKRGLPEKLSLKDPFTLKPGYAGGGG
ncbi:MAG: hypothetical protein BZY87_06210 [SAR202 cluster bacterium Io17-Chloro-G6]|nr:MAG: hypothetical protein BZY87_06210 [SAR202 cluster bacterium Io17-Chloro-G6]